LRLDQRAEPPDWHKEVLVAEEVPVLVLFDGWTSFFRDKVVPWRIGMAEKLRAQFESDVLPRYVEHQRWYAAKGQAIKSAPVVDWAVWGQWLITLPKIHDYPYFLPL